MTRRIFLDTEWTAPPWSDRAQLMWVGLADEAGRSWYGISSEVDIDPTNNAFMSGVYRLISPTEPRISRADLATAVLDFCGQVDQFWSWIPAVESFAQFFGLQQVEAARLFHRFWGVDLQMLKSLVQPWPAGWPERLCNLQDAAVAAGVEIPPRAVNHLHPRVHAEWNRSLFERIRAAGGGR